MTMKHWLWIVLFSIFIPSALLTCGGGSSNNSDPIKPLTWESSGAHMLPLWLMETGIEYPQASDFKRLKGWGKNIVINFPLNWVNDKVQRDHMLNLIDLAQAEEMNLYLRMEDFRSRVSHGAPAERLPTDDVWFENTYEPYLIDIAEYCSGRFTRDGKPWKVVFMVDNEPFEKDRFLLGPTLPLRPITPVEYVELVRKTVEALKGYPDIIVWGGGFVSPVEYDYYAKIIECIEAGLEDLVPVLNLHCYIESFSNGDIARIRDLRRRSKLPWVLTEYNHISPNASPIAKWNVMKRIHDALSPEIALAFIYRGDGLPGDTKNYRIIDTELEQLLIRAVKP